METNSEMYIKCLLVENMVTYLLLQGITDNRKLVNIIGDKFNPKNEFEQEMYSEAIIYAKQAVLN